MNPGCFLIPLFLLNQNPGSKASVGRFKDWSMARNDRYFFLLTQVENKGLCCYFVSRCMDSSPYISCGNSFKVCKRFLLLQ